MKKISEGNDPQVVCMGDAVRRRSWLSFGRLWQFLVDGTVLSLAFYLSWQLRFEFRLHQPENAERLRMMLFQLPWVVLLQWVFLLMTGCYRRLWRFISLVDLLPFLTAFTGACLPMLLWRMCAEGGGVWMVPYSILFGTNLLGFLGVLGVRCVRRMYWEKGRAILTRRRTEQNGRPERSRLVLIGAGAAGVMAARELARQGDARGRIVGFLDDEPEKQGAVISGIRVLGPVSEIARLAAFRKVDEAIITIANAPRQKLAAIIQQCKDAAVPTRIIPSLHEIIDGRRSVSSVRRVLIEDLLGRDVVMLDSNGIHRYLAGKRVMVTGAGGSIGSELVRQIAAFVPSRLVLLDQCEYALYEIHREMQERKTETEVVPVVADVSCAARMEEVFAEHHPDVVLHAAAYKHVPLMEANVREAVVNNIFGTQVVAELAGRFGVAAFVMISTDKAVNPTSVMGASKRVAELVVQEQEAAYPQTRYVSVRFGNVLGSTGSVIPLFREQIKRGGPVTVTHPDMLRYFMTIPEASRLVLQAASIGKGGEIFVLDMGEPVKIDQLARDMIRLSGFEPGTDIAIEYTGLRPGEKMFEELSTASENTEKTRHPKIFIGKIARPDPEVFRRGREALRAAMEASDVSRLRAALSALVPEATLLR